VCEAYAKLMYVAGGGGLTGRPIGVREKNPDMVALKASAAKRKQILLN